MPLDKTSDQQDAAKLAGEWAKQLGLWTSGTIVLSLTFLKDFVKEAPVSASWRIWLVTTWLLLICSLFFGHLAFGAPLTGAGKAEEWKLQVNQQTRVLSILQLTFFLLGLVGMVVFAANHLTNGLNSDKVPSVAAWQPVGCVGPFFTGSADQVEPQEVRALGEPCSSPAHIADLIRQTCTDDMNCLIVLVGSADRVSLRRHLQREFGANDGLARARADWVLGQIGASLDLKGKSFLVLTTGPSKHASGTAPEELQSDREVRILVFRQTSVIHPTGKQ